MGDEASIEGFLGISEDGMYVVARHVSGHLSSRQVLELNSDINRATVWLRQSDAVANCKQAAQEHGRRVFIAQAREVTKRKVTLMGWGNADVSE